MNPFQNKLWPASISTVCILLSTLFVFFAFAIEAFAASPNWMGTGENTDDQYGASVSSAGDVNGDGYDDVIVGAPYFSNGSSYIGRAYVYLGSPSGLSATPSATLTAEEGVYFFGASVSSAGDINGDGYGDVIVGGKPDKVYVYLGSPSGLSATQSIILTGDLMHGRFGCSLSSAGDVNGDGYGDVIVGDDRDQFDIGRAYVYLGSPSGLITTPSITLTGEAAADSFGRAVSYAGDVNGDGYGDVIVGASNYNYGQGRIYVYLGSSLGISATPSITLTGEQSYDYFGAPIASAGDVNGDGYGDVIVGAPFHSNGIGISTGRVYVYLGSPTGLSATPGINLTAEVGGYLFGASLSSADINGDGYGDVIVGAPNSGTVSVYFGSPSGLSTSPAVTLAEDPASYLYGASLSSADVNGDGYGDVIVGYSSYSSNTGRAYVYQAVPWKLDDFPIVAGTTWKYLIDGQNEVTRKILKQKVNVNGVDTSVMQYVDEKFKIYFTNDSNGILVHRQYQPNVAVQGRLINIDATFIPPFHYAGPTLGIGGSIHSQGVARTKAAGRTFDFPYTTDMTIEGMENITVPAGNFNTIKVKVTITLTSGYDNSTISSTLHFAEGIGIVKDVSVDTENLTSTAELVYTNAGIYDLAITSITQPKKITLSSGTPSKTSPIKVKIRNKGPFEETIEDASMLTNLITVTVESMGTDCLAPTPVLHADKPQKPFPITLKPGKTLTVYYDVTFDCANDPEKDIPDYRFSAVVNRAAIDGKEDTNPLDDVCPRSGTPPTDKGCGAKKPDGTLGGDILTDVVVK